MLQKKKEKKIKTYFKYQEISDILKCFKYYINDPQVILKS